MFEYLITRPLGWIIEQIYNLVANYGLSIVIFTIIVKLILLPLNIKSQRAMKKQQKLQPILAQLQEKYKNDQEKLQKEMMKLYKENNVSMTGGCLPTLIQMPILVGLYNVIRWPLSYLVGVDWMNQGVIDKVYMLRDAMAVGRYAEYAQYTEEQLANMSQIQLSKWAQIVNGTQDPWYINFNFLGLDLAERPWEAIKCFETLDFSNPGIYALLLIPILAVVTSWLTSKITQAQSGQSANQEGQAAQMSKTMMYMMPITTGIFTFTLPSGIGIYWIVSSLMQIVQQLFLNKMLENESEIEIKIPERKQLHGKKSKKR